MQAAIVQLRSRVPALCLAALFNIALIALLLDALPKQTATKPAPETQVVFVPLPLLEPPRKPAHRQHQPRAGSSAITTYFNPDIVAPRVLLPTPGEQRLSMALATCAPENYDRQSDEVRAACAKIATALAYDREHFGVKSDVAYGPYWQRELMLRKAPYLAPCMTPGGPEILTLLYCVYDVLFHGYDRKKMAHY